MKIRVEHGNFEEDEIVFYCKELNQELLDLLSLINKCSSSVIGYLKEEAYIVKPNEVFYIEVVDNKTFLYTAEDVFESNQSLSALADIFRNVGFIRISKSQLVNLFHVIKLRSLPNSRIEITLKNNEKLIVSRHYIQNVKEKLGMLE